MKPFILLDIRLKIELIKVLPFLGLSKGNALPELPNFCGFLPKILFHFEISIVIPFSGYLSNFPPRFNTEKITPSNEKELVVASKF